MNILDTIMTFFIAIYNRLLLWYFDKKYDIIEFSDLKKYIKNGEIHISSALKLHKAVFDHLEDNNCNEDKESDFISLLFNEKNTKYRKIIRSLNIVEAIYNQSISIDFLSKIGNHLTSELIYKNETFLRAIKYPKNTILDDIFLTGYVQKILQGVDNSYLFERNNIITILSSQVDSKELLLKEFLYQRYKSNICDDDNLQEIHKLQAYNTMQSIYINCSGDKLEFTKAIALAIPKQCNISTQNKSSYATCFLSLLENFKNNKNI